MLSRGFQNRCMYYMPHILWTFSVIFVFGIIPISSKAADDNTSKSMLDANQFIYDTEKEIVQALGSVILEQNGQTLESDKIIYNVRDDIATAEGNVVFTDSDNNKYYADILELNDQMRHGVIQNLYSVLDDGSRMWAERAIRENPEKHVLKDARYTPCKECELNPDKSPPWALRAKQVIHDKQDATIVYKNATFEAWGMPVLYTPYFSHPDGTIEQKSGFLTPQFGFGSDYGFNFMMPYYWVIDPSLDVTAGLRLFSSSNPQLNLEMRKRFKNALITTNGSIAYSDRTDSINGRDVYQDEELRGHFELDSLWNINNKWRAGTEIKVTSDEQYLDQYDIDNSDILTNRIYTERFNNRDYASVQLLAFQDLRLEQNVDQPNALPLANMSFVGAPNSVIGGRMQWDSSFLSLFRDGNQQDVNRLISRLGWERHDILPFGLTSKTELAVRGDIYYTTDRDIAKTNLTEDKEKYDSRAIPTLNYEVAYPLIKPLSRSQIKIKPKIGLTVRPDVDNDSDMPNEDSTDAQINMGNLFDIDRFPGFDRVEDRSHVNYALEAGYYLDNGDELNAAIGQSYRFNDQDNPFPNGSGFENQKSDIVGQVGASFDNDNHNLNYRFQIDGETFETERHEFYGATIVEKIRASAIYLFEKGSPGTEFVESREQIQATLSRPINENWGVNLSGLYDLGEDSGLRKSRLGVSYDDDCYGVTAELQRNLQRDASGTSDTKLMVRLRLKNLGEFETTAYGYDSNDDNDDEIIEQ